MGTNRELREALSKLKPVIYLGVMMLSLAGSMYGFNSFAYPLIQADDAELQQLVAPYIKLANPRYTEDKKELVVDVLANTNELEIIAADIALIYNPNVLQITNDDIANRSDLHTLFVNSNEQGKLDVSLFSDPARFEETIRTVANGELVLASLKFKVIDASTVSTKIELLNRPDDIQDSNLIEAYEVRPEIITDKLSSVNTIEIKLRDDTN